MAEQFLPEFPESESDRDRFDIVLVTGDAYVDHPSFGTALIGRWLESLGYRMGILAQPRWTDAEDFRRFGKPRLFFGVSAGNVDSMVANYTPDRRRREKDDYSPGGAPDKRPDHATVVYAQRCKEAYPDVPVVLGGIEASLRRFSHYDFVQQKVRGSVLADAKADLLVYGMGERAMKAIADGLRAGRTLEELRWIRGTACLSQEGPESPDAVILPPAEEVSENTDVFYAFHTKLKAALDEPSLPVIAQPHGAKFVIANPPADPLSPEELNSLYELPFSREYPPRYAEKGGIPALAPVKFSITTHRGCYGGCSFCAITAHQGKGVVSRPAEGVRDEVSRLSLRPDFRGTVQDIGGPTANMYGTRCKIAEEGKTGCKRPSCLCPEVCPNLETSGAPYLNLLRMVRRVQGVKHAFIASGLRHDLLVQPPQRRLFREIVQYHTGGQLKVAPEHISARTLRYMKKPPFRVFGEFKTHFDRVALECGKDLYIVPYLIAGHPGTNLEDAIDLAKYIRKTVAYAEQVQVFTPTPMTDSTCMYVTRRDTVTGETLYVPTGSDAKIQKALLQLNAPRALEKVVGYFARIGKSHLIEELIRGLRLPPPRPAKDERRFEPKGDGKKFSGKPGSGKFPPKKVFGPKKFEKKP